jgi:glycosyltransferase involved in cell wall biosynthesis
MLILAGSLSRTAFDLRFLLLSQRGALADEAEALGVPVHVLGLGREACRSFSRACLLGAMRAMRAYVDLTRDVDVVDAWLVPAYTFAGLARPLARTPVVLAGRRSSPDVARTRTWYRDAAERSAMRRVDGVVANSQAAADAAVREECVDPRRVHVIRNAVVPVERDEAERLRLRRAWGFSLEDVVIGCVGAYKPGKGQELLLEAATRLRARHPNLRYVFVGEGPLRSRLEDAIRERGLGSAVVLHGGERDARHVYAAFDVAVQASDSEGLPNAVLEAAAAGLPIVATAVGGTREILPGEESGVLVPKRDPAGLAAAIGLLAGDPALRRRLGVAACDRAREFSPERLAFETGSLYLRLAGRPEVLEGSSAGVGATDPAGEATLPGADAAFRARARTSSV